MIGKANGAISITGIGAYAPEHVVTNDDLSQMMDTSDEWIVERTGIRERRVAADDQALSDIALPAARAALEQSGTPGADVDLIIVATVTPDMAFPSAGAILADELGAPDAAAYDLSAGCTGFMYAVAQGYGMVAAGLARHALVVGGDVLSRILDWTDRGTAVLFGDGAGAVMLERVSEGGFLGFELGADGSGGQQLYLPAGGSRSPATAETVADRKHYVQMNGREVFKFATRVLVTSAARRSTTSTYTSPTRRTSGSSTTPPRSWGSRRRKSWSTSNVTETRLQARFRSLWRRRRRRGAFRRARSCS